MSDTALFNICIKGLQLLLLLGRKVQSFPRRKRGLDSIIKEVPYSSGRFTVTKYLHLYIMLHTNKYLYIPHSKSV